MYSRSPRVWPLCEAHVSTRAPECLQREANVPLRLVQFPVREINEPAVRDGWSVFLSRKEEGMRNSTFLKWTALVVVSFALTLGLLSVQTSVEAAKPNAKPDSGSLTAVDHNGKPVGLCPLKHTSVKAEVSGSVSRVTVTQEFQNPFPDKIEAIYTFPLPQDSAVDYMTMLIGERVIKGSIVKGEEVAGRLDQERPNIFTQPVAGIMPNELIRITISYLETLKNEDGNYEWVFPMVVAPQRQATSTADSSMKLPLVSEDDRPGHDISLQIIVDAGWPIENLKSESHETEIERPDTSKAVVYLKDRDFIPNKDFVLRYQVGGAKVADALPTHRTDDQADFLTLIRQPPKKIAAFSDESAGTMARVRPRTIVGLPLNTRSVVRLVTLSPGTVVTESGVQTNGQRSTSNNLMIDGVDANFGITQGGQNPEASASGTSPATTASGGVNGIVTQEGTSEIEINTFYVKPEFGRVSGSQVRITTEAGTNSFHGSVFEFFGNDALDAAGWFANSRGLKQATHHLNNYGGTFGGPIKRDKSFFFFSYEGLRLRQPMTALTQVPSISARSASPVQSFLNAFPVPNNPASSDNFAEYASTFSNPAQHETFGIRLDQRIGDNLNLTGRYSFADSSASQRGSGGLSLNTTNRLRSVSQTLTGSATYVLSPVAVVEVRANYSRLKVAGAYTLDDFGGATVPATFGSSFTFDLNGRNATLKTGEETPNIQRQLNLVSALSIVSGTHAFKFGGDFRRVMPIIGLRPFERSVLFNGVNQSLTGIATRQSEFRRFASQTPHFDNLSLFAQDEWRRTPKLTLTYGLRWELNPAPANDNSIAVDQIKDLSQLTLSKPGVSPWKTTLSNFAPRFGFIFDVDSKLMLSGGVGLHYNLGSESTGEALSDSFPILTGNSVFNSPFSQASIPTSVSNVLPISLFDPRLKLPYALNWNLGLQRSLGYRQSFSVTYLGSRGRRLTRTDSLLNQNSAFPFVRLTTNEAKSDYRALQVTFNRSLVSNLAGIVSYTLGRSRDNVSEDTPANAFISNAFVDRGPSDFDVRHVLQGVGSYQVSESISDGLKNKLLRNWAVSSIFRAQSGKPLNVVYAFPTSFGLVYLRPNVVSGQPLYLLDPNIPGGRRINPGAFSIPVGLQQGDLSRNSLRGFPLYQVDLSLRRKFNFTEKFAIQVQADAFNLFNHPNFEDPLGNDLSLGTKVDASVFRPNLTFGQSASLDGMSVLSRNPFGAFNGPGGARTLRLGVKLLF